MFYFSTANRIFHVIFTNRAPTYLPTYLPFHPIYYFMTNISGCPNLLLSAMDDLNLFEVCWSLAGPEQRAKYSYTYSIHIQPLLISSYVPWSCRTLSCHTLHVIFPIMQSREEESWGTHLQIFTCNRRAKQAH